MNAGNSFCEELNFVPLINQHADTHTNMHKTELKSSCFLVPEASDADISKSSGYECQPKLSGKMACN